MTEPPGKPELALHHSTRPTKKDAYEKYLETLFEGCFDASHVGHNHFICVNSIQRISGGSTFFARGIAACWQASPLSIWTSGREANIHARPSSPQERSHIQKYATKVFIRRSALGEVWNAVLFMFLASQETRGPLFGTFEGGTFQNWRNSRLPKWCRH